MSVCRRLREEKPSVRDDDPLLNCKRAGVRNRNNTHSKEDKRKIRRILMIEKLDAHSAQWLIEHDFEEME